MSVPHSPVVVSSHDDPAHGSVRSYTIGFGASLGATLLAYLLVTHHAFSKWLLIGVIVALALGQFIVQLLYFLHLGAETKPRWKLAVFFFMLLVVLILVFGSLWIMTNLNYHMNVQQVNNYMRSQDNL